MPEQEQKILRVEIDGTWTSDEFSDSLRSIADLYGLRAILAIEHESLKEIERLSGAVWDLGPFPLDLPFPSRRLTPRLRAAYRARGIPFPAAPLIDPSNPSDALQLLEPEEQLYVKRIQFASPGFKDLAGLGEVVGHVLDFLSKLIELGVTRRQRQPENDLREETVRKMRIENARGFVSLATDYGLYSKAELRPIVHWVDDKQAKLLPLVEHGKINGVRLLDGEDADKG